MKRGEERARDVCASRQTDVGCKEQPTKGMLPDLLTQIIEGLGYTRGCDDDDGREQHAVR
jgi:hypothetical protein